MCACMPACVCACVCLCACVCVFGSRGEEYFVKNEENVVKAVIVLFGHLLLIGLRGPANGFKVYSRAPLRISMMN